MDSLNLYKVKIELTNTQVSDIITQFIEKNYELKVVEAPFIKENCPRDPRDRMMIDDYCFSVIATVDISKQEKNPFSSLADMIGPVKG